MFASLPVQVKTVETNTAYKLNEKKALMKKIDAGKRDLNVEIELKRGTLVITYIPINC
jgi:hypothetical protein